jgi:mannose-1-phosphate guanylyltransferase
MQAIILAAGLGTRLRPLTEKMPKALIPVGGRPLIHYSLGLLKKYGVRNVVVNLHYLGEQIERALGDGSQLGLNIRYSWEKKILGTGGGIRQAAAFFPQQPVLVMNSDILIDADLGALQRFHEKKKSIATMVVRPLNLTGDKDAPTPIFLSEEDRIVSIGKTPQVPGDQKVHFTGVQILEPGFLKRLPAEGESCLIQDAYQAALQQKENVNGYLYQGYWNDLGTPERYDQAKKDVLSLRLERPETSSS